MKRIIGILMVLVLAIGMVSLAQADNAMNLTSGLAIWAEPNQNNWLRVVDNAYNLVVVGIYDQYWYIVDMYQSGLGAEGEYGYILQKYVTTTPYSITLPKDIDFYADTWSGKCNGYRYKGETFTVISENEYWLCVQLNSNAPGSAFINKNQLWSGGYYAGETATYYPEIPQETVNPYSYIPANQYWYYGKEGTVGTYGPNTDVYYEADWYIPKQWSVAIRVQPLSEVPDEQNKKLVILHQNDVVHVIVNLGVDAYVRYDDPSRPGGFIEGYVATKYWAVVGQ